MRARYLDLNDYVSRELFDHIINRLAAKQEEVEHLQAQITAMIIDPDPVARGRSVDGQVRERGR